MAHLQVGVHGYLLVYSATSRVSFEKVEACPVGVYLDCVCLNSQIIYLGNVIIYPHALLLSR